MGISWRGGPKPVALLATTLVLLGCNTTGLTTVLGSDGMPVPVLTTDNLKATPTLLSFDHKIGTTGCPQFLGDIRVDNPKTDTTISFSVENAASGPTAVVPQRSSGTLGPGENLRVGLVYDCSDIRSPYEQTFKIVPSDAKGVLPGEIIVTVRGTIHL